MYDDEEDPDELDEGGHPALQSDAAFKAWLREHPPRCLQGLRIIQIHDIAPINDVTVEFDVAHPEAGDVCALHAHSHESVDISPVHLVWRTGPSEPTLLFDSARHGWHGEIDSDAHYRDEGVGIARTCPKCQGEWFRIRVLFDYHQMDDLADEEPDFPLQDYFVSIGVTGVCASCQARANLFGMGSL